MPAEKSYITTGSGKRVDIANLQPGEFDIRDLAAAAAKMCRFLGHCRDFYSVAEHSVLVSCLTEEAGEPRGVQIAGLLHDIHEPFIGDIASPHKPLLGDVFEKLESQLADRVRNILQPGFSPADYLRVKQYDLRALHIEAALFLPGPPSWVLTDVLRQTDPRLRPRPMTWQMAEAAFLLRAHSLGLVDLN